MTASSSSLSWKYTISELSDIFSDITPINVREDYEHLKISYYNNNKQNDNTVVGNDEDDDNDNTNLTAVTTIDYTESFCIAYGYLYAIMKLEKDDDIESSIDKTVSISDTEQYQNQYRTLLLTATCITLNPANYTIWNYRRQCLYTLYPRQVQNTSTTTTNDDIDNTDTDSYDWSQLVQNELYMTSIIGGDNPKNYQIWYHRRAIINEQIQRIQLQLEQPDQEQVVVQILIQEIMNDIELKYIHSVVCIDNKNYHAWSHRQWIIDQIIQVLSLASVLHPTSVGGTDNNDDTTNEYNTMIQTIYTNELLYSHQFIQKMDIRNNSAWNYRWYIIHHMIQFYTHHTSKSIDNNEININEDYIMNILQQEIDYSIQVIYIDPYNESPYKYYIGILREMIEYVKTNSDDDKGITIQDHHQEQQQHQHQQNIVVLLQNAIITLKDIESDHLLRNDEDDDDNIEIDHNNNSNDAIDRTIDRNDATTENYTSNTEELLDTDLYIVHHSIPSIYLCSTLVEIYSIMLEYLDDNDEKVDKEQTIITSTRSSLITNIQYYITLLMTKYDTIRCKYWEYKLNAIMTTTKVQNGINS